MPLFSLSIQSIDSIINSSHVNHYPVDIYLVAIVCQASSLQFRWGGLGGRHKNHLNMKVILLLMRNTGSARRSLEEEKIYWGLDWFYQGIGTLAEPSTQKKYLIITKGNVPRYMVGFERPLSWVESQCYYLCNLGQVSALWFFLFVSGANKWNLSYGSLVGIKGDQKCTGLPTASCTQ